MLFKKYKCPVCNKFVKKYKPLPSFYEDMAKKHGYKYFGQGEMTSRETYSCPSCGASDRERLYACFLNQKLKSVDFLKLAHFAPEPSLSRFLQRKGKVKVITVDLAMENVDVRADLMQMDCFENESFDAFICSHVLEHVKDDLAALKELYRILKGDGFGIVMAPICLTINETIEDVEENCPSERWRRFGQSDHLRLYSKEGFIKKILDAGFQLEQLDQTFFSSKVFNQLGLKDTSVLYCVTKGK